MKNLLKKLFKLFKRKQPTLDYIAEEVQRFSPQDWKLGVIRFNRSMGIAKFMCPCGCEKHESIHIGKKVNAAKQIWVLEVKGNTPTLYESFWTRGKCNSHYFIKQGKVIFAD